MNTSMLGRLPGALLLLVLLRLLGGCGGENQLSSEGVTSSSDDRVSDHDGAYPTSQVDSEVECAGPQDDGSCARSEGELCCPVRAYRYLPDAGCWQDASIIHDTLACVPSIAVGGTSHACGGSGMYDCFERSSAGSQDVIVTTYTPGEGDASMTSLGYVHCSIATRDTVIKGGQCANQAPSPED